MELERTRVDIVQCAKTYADGTRGLQPTDLVVEPGEVLALLGPSGCGKTTLLRLIAGLEAPDAGSRIAFGGTDVTQLPIERRGVGMVFQHYALFPQMSVEANIGFGLKIRGVAEDERRRTVGELVDLVRLNGLEKKRPAELSGGQRQRAYIAMVLCQDTRYILLDEPLNNLDMAHAVGMMKLLRQAVQDTGKTVVVVLHDINFAASYADHIIAMKDGRVYCEGPPEAVVQDAVLSDLYEIAVRVHVLAGRRFCDYF